MINPIDEINQTDTVHLKVADSPVQNESNSKENIEETSNNQIPTVMESGEKLNDETDVSQVN